MVSFILVSLVVSDAGFLKMRSYGWRAYCGAIVFECTTSVPEIICEVGAGLAAEYV